MTFTTKVSGPNADRLPTVNLQPPTPQTDREVTKAGPQNPIIRRRPIQKLELEGRMTHSRAPSSTPPSLAGKRKADDTEKTARSHHINVVNKLDRRIIFCY